MSQTNLPSARRIPLPDPPPVEQFPPAVWPTPEHRREATIKAARAAGVSDADITSAVGCGRPPLYFWGALVVLLIIIIYVLYTFMSNGGNGGGHDRELDISGDGAEAECTNWESAASSVSGALPWCGDDHPPHFLHGRLTAFNSAGKACHSETITGEIVDSNAVEAMAQTAYDMCGTHPDAYLGVGAYTCSPAGGEKAAVPACSLGDGKAVRGTTADLGAEKLVGGITYGNPTCGSRRRR